MDARQSNSSPSLLSLLDVPFQALSNGAQAGGRTCFSEIRDMHDMT